MTDKRKSSKIDVVYSESEYRDPDYYENGKRSEPTRFVSWEEFLEVTGKGPDWTMRA